MHFRTTSFLVWLNGTSGPAAPTRDFSQTLTDRVHGLMPLVLVGA